jgi:hypothetical protein
MMPTLFTLGEEGVALRRRLRTAHQLAEQLALGLQPLLERLVHRRLHATDVVLGGEEAAELARVGLAEVLEDLGMAARGLHLLVQVPHLLQRPALGGDLVGEGHGALAQLALLDDLVDQTHLEAGLGWHVLTAGHHLQRLLGADDPWQPLGAAGAWQQAEVHFRQAAARRGHGDAVVGAQRHFEAAAEGGAVDRGDHRLGRAFHGVLHIEQARALLRAAELGDVRAGDEGAALADDHDRLGASVGQARRDAARQPVAHRRGEGVHRR